METRKRAHENDEHDKEQEKRVKKPRTKEKCKACGEERVLLLHLPRSSKCREKYPEFETMKKQARKATKSAYYEKHADHFKATMKQNYQKNHSNVLLRKRN